MKTTLKSKVLVCPDCKQDNRKCAGANGAVCQFLPNGQPSRPLTTVARKPKLDELAVYKLALAYACGDESHPTLALAGQFNSLAALKAARKELRKAVR